MVVHEPGIRYTIEILLTYHRARYYDANLGRFTSRDPIGIQDDINLYTYTANSPVNYVDRMGKEKKFITEHDATELLLKDMESGKEENIFVLSLKSAEKGYYNLKYRETYRNISFNKETNESCKDNYSSSCVVYIDGIQTQTLPELGNFLIGYNFNYAGYTLDNQYGTFFNDINQAGIFTEDFLKRGNFLQDNDIYNTAYENEKYDRLFYEAGYKYAQDERRGVIGSSISRYLDF